MLSVTKIKQAEVKVMERQSPPSLPQFIRTLKSYNVLMFNPVRCAEVSSTVMVTTLLSLQSSPCGLYCTEKSESVVVTVQLTVASSPTTSWTERPYTTSQSGCHTCTLVMTAAGCTSPLVE